MSNMIDDRRAFVCCAIALCAMVAVPAPAAPPTPDAIVKACDEAGYAAQCERLLEIAQMKQFPSVAERDGRVLRLKTRSAIAPIELRDNGDPANETGAEYRAHAFWDYWPQRKIAVISVMTQGPDHYLAVDLERGTQNRLPAEPLLAPDGQRFLVADLCDKQCGNVIQIWRFDRDRMVRERSFKPAEKWYEAEVAWRDAATVAIDYSVAAPKRRLAEPGELTLVRARPRVLKLTDPEWTIDNAGR